MVIMAPTVSMMAHAAGYGDRRTTGQGRSSEDTGHARDTALMGSSSATSREATINAADILKAVVEATRVEPPPRRNPVANEAAISGRDLVKLELIRTLVEGQAECVRDAEAAGAAPAVSLLAAHVDVMA